MYIYMYTHSTDAMHKLILYEGSLHMDHNIFVFGGKAATVYIVFFLVCGYAPPIFLERIREGTPRGLWKPAPISASATKCTPRFLNVVWNPGKAGRAFLRMELEGWPQVESPMRLFGLVIATRINQMPTSGSPRGL